MRIAVASEKNSRHKHCIPENECLLGVGRIDKVLIGTYTVSYLIFKIYNRNTNNLIIIHYNNYNKPYDRQIDIIYY